VSYFVNQGISEAKYKGLKEFDFEAPLTRLIWIASILCISTSYGMSWLLIRDLTVNGTAMPELWWQLASIISCGTLAAVLIPESPRSSPVRTASTCTKSSSPARRRSVAHDSLRPRCR